MEMKIPDHVLAHANPKALQAIASMRAREARYPSSGSAPRSALTVLPPRSPQASLPSHGNGPRASHERKTADQDRATEIRMMAIMRAPEAQGQELYAHMLAQNASIPVPDAIAALARTKNDKPVSSWAPVVDEVNARRASQAQASERVKAKMLGIVQPSGRQSDASDRVGTSSWAAAVDETNSRRGFGKTQAEASEMSKAKMRRIMQGE